MVPYAYKGKLSENGRLRLILMNFYLFAIQMTSG